jgi:hypothetical protein
VRTLLNTTSYSQGIAENMRQITADAARAFNNNQTFKRSNTEVRKNEFGAIELRLHGNSIAYKNDEGMFISNGGWSSATTKERLNGLSGVSVVQKDWEWFLNGEEWGGQWIKVN